MMGSIYVTNKGEKSINRLRLVAESFAMLCQLQDKLHPELWI